MKTHRDYIEQAYQQACLGFEADEVPVGALIVSNGQVIAQAHNTKESIQNPLLHAEINCITAASRILKTWRLNSCTLYTTLEPCVMCAAACIQARIATVVYGAIDLKGGGESLYHLFSVPRLNHPIKAIYCDHSPSKEILKNFFTAKRRPRCKAHHASSEATHLP